MRLDPDDDKLHIVCAYHRIHNELRELQPYAPSDHDDSSEAVAFRQVLTDRQQILEELTHSLLGQVERRIGQHLLPLGCVSVYLN